MKRNINRLKQLVCLNLSQAIQAIPGQQIQNTQSLVRRNDGVDVSPAFKVELFEGKIGVQPSKSMYQLEEKP